MDESRAIEKLLDVASRLQDEQYSKPCRSNEQATKKWIIEPSFEALGWDVHSTDVHPEDEGGVSGKADYGLRIDSKVRIFVEAKALGKTLDDKDAEQTSNYANNKGVPWCVLTNGRIWRVYKSSSTGAALPERLLFEIEIENDQEKIHAAWQQLRYLSRPSVQNGDLDKFANQIFVDNRLRDRLQHLLRQPSLKFINALKEELPEFSTNQIKEALQRMVLSNLGDTTPPALATVMQPAAETATKAAATRTKKQPPTGKRSIYSEAHHLEDKPQHIIHLFHQLQQSIQGIAGTEVQITYKKKTVGYQHKAVKAPKTFADIAIYNKYLRLFLVVNPKEIASLPANARDLTNIGSWGNGDLEFRISSSEDIEPALPFIRLAYEKTRK